MILKIVRRDPEILKVASKKCAGFVYCAGRWALLDHTQDSRQQCIPLRAEPWPSLLINRRSCITNNMMWRTKFYSRQNKSYSVPKMSNSLMVDELLKQNGNRKGSGLVWQGILGHVLHSRGLNAVLPLLFTVAMCLQREKYEQL